MPNDHKDEFTLIAGERYGLVSIIIPFLNAEQFLAEAVVSVLAQTYRRWELLLVNDGSTDQSATIAAEFANRHPTQARCLQHADSGWHGTSTSRNLGIANSKGEYLAFLDSDDVWFPDKLERQVALLAAQPEAAMVFGSCLRWHSWTGKTEDLAKDEFAPVLEGEEPGLFVDLPMRSIREVWHTPAPSGALVRRDAANAVGNFESGFDNLYEDQAFYFKLGLNAKALASHECWYKYRQHPHSVCAIGVRTGAQVIAKMKFLQWATQYLAFSKIQRPDLVEALLRELCASTPHSSRSLMSRVKIRMKKRVRQARMPNVRAIAKKVPGIWSTWQLGHALREALVDSSRRSQPEIKRDFNSADPWNYNTDELERIRHHREAEMLDHVSSSTRFSSALEIGCAEGAFTEILADRCSALLATDFSDIALNRARLRCEPHRHVRFSRIDLRNDALPGTFDLIVAIHVVEYIKNPLMIRRVRENLVRALQPGGYLLLGSCTGDNEFREGLWWSRYMLRGGRRINEFMASHPALSIIQAEINPLPGSISRDILLRKTK
jgi:glycosyltransferase involved in cell wall biosynthesis/SAM-dependent methyltransferase